MPTGPDRCMKSSWCSSEPSSAPIIRDALTTMDWMANSEWNAGKRDAALRLYEDRLKLQQRRLGPKHVDTVRSANALVQRYSAAGQLPRAVALLGELYASDPKNTLVLLQLASLQAWLGRHADLAATCRLAVANVNGAESPTEPERVAKACCLLRHPTDPTWTPRLALARRAVELGKGNAYLPYFQMALGMALFRSGHDADAERTLFAAWDRARYNNRHVACTSAFYRAMCLFHLGKQAEARELATQSAKRMPPLPADPNDPLANGASTDDVICWLAYKEAREMLKLEVTPSGNAGKKGG